MAATVPADQDRWRAWLADWPLPFPALAAVRAYCGRERPAEGDYFTEVVAEGDDGYRPMARAEVLLESREHWAGRDHTAELDLVRCPHTGLDLSATALTQRC